MLITNLAHNAMYDTKALVRLLCLVVVTVSVIAAAIVLIAQVDVYLGFFTVALMGGGGTIAAVTNTIVKARGGRGNQSGKDPDRP